jgi:RHS repeat-associated protein
MMKYILVVFFAAVASLFCVAPLSAQAYFQQFGNNPSTAPLPVPGGYMDASNGNLHIEIPIASIAERGHVPYVAKLVYDSHIWQQVTGSGSLSWQPTNVPSLPTTWGGWRLMTSAGTGSGVSHSVTTQTCYTKNGNLEIPHPYVVYDNFNWVAPDGHSVPFGGFTTPGSSVCNEGAEPNYSGISRDARGYHIAISNYTTAVVYAPDGTQVFPNVEDTNGNYYSVPNSSGDVTDTRGQMPITTTVSGSTVTYAVQSSQGSYNIVLTTESIPVNTAFGVVGVTEYSGNVTVPSSLALPDGTFYSFGYDEGATGAHFGTLSSIKSPTGGTTDYTNSIFKDAYGNPYLFLEGFTQGGTWTFSPAVVSQCGTACSQNLTVTAPSGDQQFYAFTMYSGMMWETQASYYTGSQSAANLLQSVTIGYNTANPPYIQATSFVTTVPSASGSLTKQTTLTYDTSNFGNIVNKNEWNFYPGTLPTTPDRVISSSYLTNSDNNMVNKQTGVTLTSGSSTYSSTLIAYDGAAPASVTGIINHDDTNFGVGYTARGNPTSISYSGLATKTFAYDTTGEILTSQDSNNNTTTFSYADCYLKDGLPPTSYSPTTATNAFPTTIVLAITGATHLCYYWGSGKPATIKDQNNQTTAHHFLDVRDRQTHLVPPLGWNEWQYSTNELEVDVYTGIGTGTPTTTCGNAGSCRHNATYLDSFGRVSSSVLLNDPDGATTTSSIVYDSNSRIQTTANPYRSTGDPTYGVETPSYDGLNRTTQVQHADGSSAKIYYGRAVSNVSGALASQVCPSTFGYGYPGLSVDEAGMKRETWTDGFGRIIEVDEPDSTGNLTSTTCNAYQPNDFLFEVSHTVAGYNQLRSYSHDNLGRLTTVGGPEGLGTSYSYTNKTGQLCSGNPTNVCQRTDGRSITTTYSYDQLNRLKGVSYSDGVTPPVIYCYDDVNGPCGGLLSGTNGLGRLTAMQDGSGTTAWNYDANGRIVTESRTIASITKTISYTYNGDSTISSITYPSGRKINYTEGNAQRIQSATDSAGTQYAATASYAPAGSLSAVVYGKVSGGFGGFNVSQGFNKRWNLTSIVATSSAGTALNLSYCFYPLVSGACPATGSSNNGIVRVATNNKDTGRTETFSYDPLNRLLSASTQATSGADCWGQAFTDDAYGNLYLIGSTQTGCTVGTLSATVSSATNHLGFSAPPQATYDSVGNMTNDGLYGYTFDAEDRITSTTASSITYVYDGLGRRVEKSGTTLYWRSLTGEVLAETDTSGNVKNEYVYFAGQRIAWWDGASPQNLYYIHADSLGSTRTIAEANGTVCYDSEYTPYGQEVNHVSSCPSVYRYRFTGYELDPETNLSYAGARYYSYKIGRFMSPDPLTGNPADPQSFDRYTYVGNSPPNFTDPSGLLKKPCLSRNPGGCLYSWGDLGGSANFGAFLASLGSAGYGADFGGSYTLDGLNVGLSDLSGYGSNGIAPNYDQIAIFLFGGTPFLTPNLTPILSDPNNPPLDFEYDEVFLDPQGADTLVGVYTSLPNQNTPWTLSFVLPVVPIALGTPYGPLPIADVAVAGSLTYIPTQQLLCGSSGLGLQVPPGASSISAGPIMSGAIQNTEQIETGPSISFGAGLLFGYQITRSGGQQIGGPTISPDPGASITYTSGKCASIP